MINLAWNDHITYYNGNDTKIPFVFIIIWSKYYLIRFVFCKSSFTYKKLPDLIVVDVVNNKPTEIKSVQYYLVIIKTTYILKYSLNNVDVHISHLQLIYYIEHAMDITFVVTHAYIVTYYPVKFY